MIAKKEDKSKQAKSTPKLFQSLNSSENLSQELFEKKSLLFSLILCYLRILLNQNRFKIFYLVAFLEKSQC